MRIITALIALVISLQAIDRVPQTDLSPTNQYVLISALDIEEVEHSFLVPLEVAQLSPVLTPMPGFMETAGIEDGSPIRSKIRLDVLNYEVLWVFFNETLSSYARLFSSPETARSVSFVEAQSQLEHNERLAHILLCDFLMLPELKLALTNAELGLHKESIVPAFDDLGKQLTHVIQYQAPRLHLLTDTVKILRPNEQARCDWFGNKFILTAHPTTGILNRSWRAYTGVKGYTPSGFERFSYQGILYEKNDSTDTIQPFLCSPDGRRTLITAQDQNGVAYPSPQQILLHDNQVINRLPVHNIRSVQWSPTSHMFCRIHLAHGGHFLDFYSQSGQRISSYPVSLQTNRKISGYWSPDGNSYALHERNKCNLFDQSGQLRASFAYPNAAQTQSIWLNDSTILSIICPEKKQPLIAKIFDLTAQETIELESPPELTGLPIISIATDCSKKHLAIRVKQAKNNDMVWVITIPGPSQQFEASLFHVPKMFDMKWADKAATLLITAHGNRGCRVSSTQDVPNTILCMGSDTVKDAALDVSGKHLYVPLKEGSLWSLRHYFNGQFINQDTHAREQFLKLFYQPHTNMLFSISRSTTSKERLVRLLSSETPGIIRNKRYQSIKDILVHKNGVIFRENNTLHDLQYRQPETSQDLTMVSLAELMESQSS